MDNKEQIVELVSKVIRLKNELKATSAAYRDQIKSLETEIQVLLEENKEDEES